MVITFGFAGGFTGGWFASKGDPFWTLSGGLAGVISVSAGADVYHPSLAYILATSGGILAVYVGDFIEQRLRIDDAVGAVAVHGFCGFYGVFLVGIFAGGFPTGVNNVPVSFGGQLIGILTFFPLGFLPGFVGAWVLKKMNLLRVPPEVELEGLDIAEFQQDFYPEFEREPEVIITPEGFAVHRPGRSCKRTMSACWRPVAPTREEAHHDRRLLRSHRGARRSRSSGRSGMVRRRTS